MHIKPKKEVIMKKGKNLVFLCFLILIAAMVVISFTNVWAAPKSKTTVFRWTEQSPSGSMRSKTFEAFKRRVEKETGGRAKMEIYYSQSLVTEKESIHAVSKGTADIVCTGPVKHKSELPNWQVFTTLTEFPEGREMQKLMTKALAEIPKLAEDYRKVNQKVFAIQPLPYSALFMAPSIKNLWDIKGKTIRVYAPNYGMMLNVLGAMPVSMPFAECYMALQRGAIDGVHSHVEGGHRFKLHEVNKTILLLKTWSPGVPNLISVNLDTLSKLSAADQKIFQDAADEILSEQFIDLQNAQMKKIFEDFAKAKVKIVDVPAADITKWLSDPKIKALPDTWGIKNGATDVVKQVRELVAQFLK